MRDWQKNNPEKFKESARKSFLKRQYGLTPERLAAMQRRQLNRCAICGEAPTTRPLHVDHAHNTGKVRGLLCTQCNTGLGMFKDSELLLSAAVMYLGGWLDCGEAS